MVEASQPIHADPRQRRLVCYTALCNLWITFLLSSSVRLPCVVRIPPCVVPRCLTHPCSASVIGLYVSYVTPIYFRITSGKDKLKPGPFYLGRWSRPVGATAVAWVAFMVVMLLFPYSQTVGPQTTSEFALTSSPSARLK